MKKTTKALLLTLCAVVLVAGTVLGTLAYLTDRSTVENTFTVGNVDIKVDESAVEENGEPSTDPTTGETLPRTEEGNDYHLIPGEKYPKDPTMTVKAKSEDSYVRMILTIHNHSAVQAVIDNPVHGLTDYADLLGGWNEETWRYIGFTVDSTANTIAFEFRYFDTVNSTAIVPGGDADVVLPALFTELIIPGTLTGEELAALYGAGGTTAADGDFRMNVEGHAIQAATFADEDAAWVAFEQQYSAANP